MPTPAESRLALVAITNAAVTAGSQLLSSLTGSGEAQRAELLEGVPALIAYFSDGSSALAADLYDEERERAAARGRFTAEPVIVDRSEKIARAVVWAAAPLLDAVGDPGARLAKVISLETARPYRDTITTNQRRDPEAVGWRRIARGGGCRLCRMLADRGAVYRHETARFASHTHCRCGASPVFKGEDAPEASVMQYVASKRRTTERDRARLREYLAANYGD